MILTAQEIRLHVQTTAESEPRLRSIVAAVEQEFSNRTRRIWTKKLARVDVYDDNSCETIFLRGYPVIANLSVKEKAAWVDPWTDLVADVDYRLDGGMLHSFRDPYWAKFVQVTADVGYEQADVPADVKRAIVLEVLRTVIRDAEERMTVVSELIPQGGTTTFLDLAREHPLFQQAVHRYRRQPQ